MQVLPGGEGLDEPLVAGQVRHDPHLDLAVVRAHQALERPGGVGADDEAAADPAALLGADRDVLQVGVGRAEPPGRGDGLLERRPDPGVLADRGEQALDGLPQPDRVAVLEQVQQERVLGRLVEVLQRLGVGGVPGLGALGLRHLELLEQHPLELLGRAEVDLLVDLDEGEARGLGHPDVVVLAQLLQVLDVDRDPRALHPDAAPAPAGSSRSASRAVPSRSASSPSSTASSSATAAARMPGPQVAPARGRRRPGPRGSASALGPARRRPGRGSAAPRPAPPRRRARP